MSLSRRDFLKLGGLTAVTASTSACSVIGQEIAREELPESLQLPPTSANPSAAQGAPHIQGDRELRLLNRAGYGPRPGDLYRVREMGFEAYLEEQLAPESIEDTAVDIMLRNLTLYQMDASQLVAQEPTEAAKELIGTTVMRALYSKRQLFEAMVEFWSDHFNIYLRKNDAMPLLKLMDDRDAIRPYAMGKFRDLLAASAHSPAMLVYLDNVRNQKREPNENYARELMELHTLGVKGGYTQQDVQEVARALTGWTVARRGRREGQTAFNRQQHDQGEKEILGNHLPAGQGEQDLEQVLEILAAHLSTARFIATKLVRRFVADDPPADLVSQVTETYVQSDGDIRNMLRVIFLSDEFSSAPAKLKRPFTYLVSAMRGLHADLGRSRQIGEWMQLLGQPLFLWPPPDGYPDVAAAWTSNLLPRWNFALALVHGDVSRASVPFEELISAAGAGSEEDALNLFSGLLFGRAADARSFQLFTRYLGDAGSGAARRQERLRDVVAIMLAGPQFQWT